MISGLPQSVPCLQPSVHLTTSEPPVHPASSDPLTQPVNSVPTCGMDQNPLPAVFQPPGRTTTLLGPQLQLQVQPHDSLLTERSLPPTGLLQAQPPLCQNPLTPDSQPLGGSFTLSGFPQSHPQTQPSVDPASSVSTCESGQNLSL